ncbi:MAG: hypothetical protein KY410_07970 [Proteobacteria bacterium]|nr:hypothetical protein [Pseudomonadota bacterium]
MRSVNEETLVLLYYGELDAADARAVRSLLAQDAELGAQFAELTAELDAVPDPEVPERDELYGRRTWARVDAALDAQTQRHGAGFSNWRGFRFAGGLLVVSMVALIAFQFGRVTSPPAHQFVALPEIQRSDSNSQARLLEASLVTHFDNADRLLTEIANNQGGEVDIESEKEWAKVLLVANRLYRFAAEQAGQARIAELLADMEPVLIELANGSANGEGQLTPNEYRNLRQSIAERGLVFKVRSTNIGLKPTGRQPTEGSL